MQQIICHERASHLIWGWKWHCRFHNSSFLLSLFPAPSPSLPQRRQCPPETSQASGIQTDLQKIYTLPGNSSGRPRCGWGMVSNIAKRRERKLVCLRAVLIYWPWYLEDSSSRSSYKLQLQWSSFLCEIQNDLSRKTSPGLWIYLLQYKKHFWSIK